MASPLRVLLTATSYPRSEADWRGVFIRHMLDGLARHPDLRMQYWGPPGPVSSSATYVASAADREWLDALLERGGIAHLLRNSAVEGGVAALGLLRRLRSIYASQAPELDVIHANWLQCALPLSLAGSARSKPLVTTVLGTDFGMLKSGLVRQALRSTFAQRRTLIAPNAEWMVPTLCEVFADVATIRAVPFGIADRWYAINRRVSAANRWLVVSRLTKRKIGPLFDWAAPLFAGGYRELHLFGPMQEQLTIPEWVHYHGSTNADALANEWFPSAAGLLTLSEHDEGRPQVMLEAMASAMPIIASPLPAHRDLVNDEITGFIVSSPTELEQALVKSEQPTENARLGDNARAEIRTRVGTWDDCAARYHAAYREVMGN